ncbi:SDR family NAD(P)-dependent oxidoreductase [Methanococcoides sp. FTZ1]|uniref:SDR family NAD(P)-dependent oxidoreductase n=1 Tax=Methanococcoides sp. FTZ1 TaxID=3439061 RepID=UPI003F85645B
MEGLYNDNNGPKARHHERIALITGGSSGIGFELAKLFVKHGYQLLLVAKPEDELLNARKLLQEIYPGTRIMVRAVDLSRDGSAQEVYSFSKEHFPHVDVLVNCAGFGTYGFLNDIDSQHEHDMLNLHVLTLYDLTRLYLRDMLERDEGQIINMASISAFQPNPYFTTYGASKSFILQFSRSLNYELREMASNVHVMAVCPTAVKGTGFQKAARMENTNTFNSWMATTPETVARDTYRAMQKKKDMVIPGRILNLTHKIITRLPTSWLVKLSRSQLREKYSQI